MLSHTLNGVPTIVKSPKFQLNKMTASHLYCVTLGCAYASQISEFYSHSGFTQCHQYHWIFEFKRRFEKKNPNLYKCGFICSIIMRLFNVTQIILNIGVTTIFASLFWIIEIVIINCEHTTGMLENHVTEMWLDTDCQMRIICRWTLN